MYRIKKTVPLIVIILFIFCIPFKVGAAKIPSPSQAFYVNDFADVLDGTTKQYIQNAAFTLDSKTTAQIVVVTVKQLEENQDINQFATDLFRDWGIGNKEKNNGVLILLSINDRLTRIEVGYGLEGRLPDGKTGRIQDEFMSPHFAAGDFNEGIKQGFSAIALEVYSEYGIESEQISDIEVPVEGVEIPPFMLVIGIIGIIILIILDFKFTGGTLTFFLLHSLARSGRGGGGSRGSGGGGRSGGGGSTRRW